MFIVLCILHTRWTTRDLKSQGQLSIDSSGYKNMKITSGLTGSKVDARGGIVGGCLEIQDFNTIGKWTVVIVYRGTLAIWKYSP